MTNLLMNGFKRPAITLFEDLDHPTIPEHPTIIANGSQASWDLGVENAETRTSNPLGVEQTAQIFPISENPNIQITFPRKNIVLLGFVLDRRPTEKNNVSNAWLINGMKVAGSEYAAADAGNDGNGIIADAVSIGSYLGDNGLSLPLTQGTFATFDPATETTSFAVGADGALKFSNDLLGKNISLRVARTLANAIVFDEGPYSRWRMTIRVIENDLTTTDFIFSEVTVDAAASGTIDLNEPTMPVTFRPIYDGSGCSYVEVIRGQKAWCREALAE